MRVFVPHQVETANPSSLMNITLDYSFEDTPVRASPSGTPTGIVLRQLELNPRIVVSWEQPQKQGVSLETLWGVPPETYVDILASAQPSGAPPPPFGYWCPRPSVPQACLVSLSYLCCAPPGQQPDINIPAGFGEVSTYGAGGATPGQPPPMPSGAPGPPPGPVSDSHQSSGAAVGAAVGASVGGAVALVAAAVGIWWFLRWRRKRLVFGPPIRRRQRKKLEAKSSDNFAPTVGGSSSLYSERGDPLQPSLSAAHAV